MKILISLTAIACSLSFSLQAQQTINVIKYDYDAQGNLVARYLFADPVLLKSTSATQELTSELTLEEISTAGHPPVEVQEDPTVKLYPNQVTSELTVQLEGYTEGQARVYNSLGMSVLQTTLAAGGNTLPMDGKPAGMYIVKVKVADKVLSYKVVKY